MTEVVKQREVQRRQPSHSQLRFQIPFRMRARSSLVKLKIHFIHIKGNAGAGSWLLVIVAQSRFIELENCSTIFFLDLSLTFRTHCFQSFYRVPRHLYKHLKYAQLYKCRYQTVEDIVSPAILCYRVRPVRYRLRQASLVVDRMGKNQIFHLTVDPITDWGHNCGSDPLDKQYCSHTSKKVDIIRASSSSLSSAPTELHSYRALSNAL